MMPDILFDPAPPDLELMNGEIHVFCAALDLPFAQLKRFAEILSEDERERAARFVFERDKNRFIAGRGMLREILGRLLQIEPDDLIFSYGDHGKPRLAAPVEGRFLHFNLAHSDSLAVYAVSREHEVGIDIERVHRIEETEEIAAQFFSEREHAQWRSFPEDEKMESFFNCWTRKEALLKASGKGVGELLDQIEVFFTPDASEKLFSLADEQWSLWPLKPAVDYVAAIAAGNSASRIHCWKWQSGMPAKVNFQPTGIGRDNRRATWPVISNFTPVGRVETGSRLRAVRANAAVC